VKISRNQNQETERPMIRCYAILCIAFNLTTCGVGATANALAWRKLPQPVPPVVGMFSSAAWFGLFFVSLLMAAKAAHRRGAFGPFSSTDPAPPGKTLLG
jgi:hypothetical protein